MSRREETCSLKPFPRFRELPWPELRHPPPYHPSSPGLVIQMLTNGNYNKIQQFDFKSDVKKSTWRITLSHHRYKFTIPQHFSSSKHFLKTKGIKKTKNLRQRALWTTCQGRDGTHPSFLTGFPLDHIPDNWIPHRKCEVQLESLYTMCGKTGFPT